jgi:hypothetical protein
MIELEIVRTVAALVASGSVVVAARSFRHTKEQARTTFEDALAREYRDIAGRLPPGAFYQDGRADLGEEHQQALFRYFDLSNEQLRLIEEGRIRPSTARVWSAGIKDLMTRDTFQHAWSELAAGVPDDFFTALSSHMAEWGLETSKRYAEIARR